MHDCLGLEGVEVVEELASVQDDHVNCHWHGGQGHEAHHNGVVEGVQTVCSEEPGGQNSEVYESCPGYTHHNPMDQFPICTL